jgi:hypothetical protein
MTKKKREAKEIQKRQRHEELIRSHREARVKANRRSLSASAVTRL